MQNKRGFASDNNAGVHPDIFQEMQAANHGHVIAYGDDPYTGEAVQLFREHFGSQVEVFFVYNGTAANVLGLTAVTRSFHSIICSDVAHLNVDECGAPEKFTGCKLLPVSTTDGKLTVAGIKTHLHGFGFEHHAQPKAISITQTTEVGTIYETEEVKQISRLAKENNLLLHMDGARLSNAVVSAGCSLAEMTRDAGIDVLSFGGTKNGMMFGEAVVFLNPELAENFKYIRKQGMQLGSKLRFVSAQFKALLTNDLWKKNAAHANRMAQYLAEKVKEIPEIKITQPVQANGVFAIVPPEFIPALQKEFFFYMWDENISEVRWMTSFDTRPEDIDQFVELLKRTIQK